MEIRYSREMNHNYMIIEAPEEETGYAVQMLSANAIEGLLKFRVRQTEEAREYYYEITSRQPLRRVLEKRTLSGQKLRSILLGVLAVLKRVEEYLLKEEQLLLDPEYLYLEPLNPSAHLMSCQHETQYGDWFCPTHHTDSQNPD